MSRSFIGVSRGGRSPNGRWRAHYRGDHDDEPRDNEPLRNLADDTIANARQRALDEGQRVVRQLSAGLIDARERMTATLRVGDLGIARNQLAISGVLTLYPMLVTEAGARTPPLERALRVSYHPADGRLLTYDDATRAALYRGGALTDEVFRATTAGGGGADVVAGYRGPRARPEHDSDGEPDPDHDLAAGVSP